MDIIIYTSLQNIRQDVDHYSSCKINCASDKCTVITRNKKKWKQRGEEQSAINR